MAVIQPDFVRSWAEIIHDLGDRRRRAEAAAKEYGDAVAGTAYAL